MPLRRKHKILWTCGVLTAIGAVALLLMWRSSRNAGVGLVTGAVLTDHDDPHQQRPVADAVLIAKFGDARKQVKSNTAGYFRIELEPRVYAGDPITLRVEHPRHHPLETTVAAGEEIQVIRMLPLIPVERVTGESKKRVTIANIRIRYATKATSTANVGTVARTFEIVNRGNVPCEGKQPCSPDRKWKASLGTVEVDTGDDSKQFRNARLSCIAGPCPFTAVERDDFSRGGRKIRAVVRNWSDPVTYLLEAEVAQTAQTEMIRYAYPVIVGRSLNFTLPAPAQGPSVEAEMEGAAIVFPLGPQLKLSWANCRLELGADGTKLYRCELKPGFDFRQS